MTPETGNGKAEHCEEARASGARRGVVLVRCGGLVRVSPDGNGDGAAERGFFDNRVVGGGSRGGGGFNI